MDENATDDADPTTRARAGTRARRGRTLARRTAAVALALAAFVALALLVCRLLVGWVFPVSSGSMEPTIMTGEWVFLRYDDSAPDRFGIIAFKGAGGGASIKRTIGLPSETVLINATGDVRIDGEMLGPRPGRPPLTPIFDSRLQAIDEHWRYGGTNFDPWTPGDGTADEVWHIDARRIGRRAAAGLLRFHDRVTDGALDASGVYRPGSHAVHDVAVEFDVRVTQPGGSLVVRLTEQGDVFELRVMINAGGDRRNVYMFRRSRTGTWDGNVEIPPGKPVAIAAGMARLAEGEWTRVRFSNVDNWLSGVLDDQAPTTISYEANTEWLDPLSGRPTSPGERVSIGAEGLVLDIRNIRVLRDFHVVPQGRYAIEQELRLGADEVFVLGDSLGASRDSRERGPVQLARIVGRAESVVWPLAARRPLK